MVIKQWFIFEHEDFQLSKELVYSMTDNEIIQDWFKKNHLCSLENHINRKILNSFLEFLNDKPEFIELKCVLLNINLKKGVLTYNVYYNKQNIERQKVIDSWLNHTC